MKNIQEYIESGVLEQYVLGELAPAAAAEVEAQAARWPEVRDELNQIESALGNYAQAHAVTPPAAMRERVLGNVLAQISTQKPVANTSLRAEVDAVAQRYHTTRADAEHTSASTASESTGRTMWALAASVALVVSLAANALLYSNWQQASEHAVALENQQARIAAATQVSDRTINGLREQNTILRDDQFKAVALAGTKQYPDAHARVLFNPTSQKVFLDVKKLPALAAGKQYQLWALDNGKPVDAGILAAATMAGDSLQQMKDIASAQAFAMTVEPTGGSVSPTLSTMTVIGTI